MFTDIFWRFLILETFVLGTLFSYCIYENPQKQFCTSELVLKAKLHKGIDFKGRYRMEILTVFRGNLQALNITNNRTVKVETTMYFNFMSRDEYAIFGRNKNGIIYIEKCNGIMPWEFNTRFQRFALAEFYKTGCDCIDEIGNYTYDMFCQWNFSFMERRGEYCTWVETSFLRNCQKRFPYWK